MSARLHLRIRLGVALVNRAENAGVCVAVGLGYDPENRRPK